MKDSRTEMAMLMMPNDANVAGFVQGGAILNLVDHVAYVCAARHAGSYCVTASVDRVDFRSPIKVGQLVIVKASLTFVGRTSMEIGIQVEAEDLQTGRAVHTNSCYVTMVAVDDRGRPREVPRLILETEEERRQFEAGRQRHDLRVKARQAH